MSRTYIERTLPVEQLNPVAMSEGNAKKPVYQMHKWWARRLGSVFRTLILGAFAEARESDAAVWRRFTEGGDLGGKVVLDPFMGGGTSVVEAIRLGCRVIGVDINPVAWFITKKEIEPVDLADLDAAYCHLEETAGRRIKKYYHTRCPSGHEADVMYFFWVKVAECPRCGSEIQLFPNYELSRRDHVNVVFCPQCLSIIETKGYQPQTVCPECQAVFDPRKGVAGRGVYHCPACGHKERLLDAVARKGGPLEMQLHALEGYCPTCGRFFKRVDEADLALWEEASAECAARWDELLIPRLAIPTEGRSDPRPVNHGYTYFWQMFNARQLLSLSILLEEILKLPDPNVRELMLLAFSDCLDTNNMFCKYEISYHKISVFFGLHAYHPIERPAENNVWGTRYGRGTFTRCFQKMRRGKQFCHEPYERLTSLRGKRYSKRTGDERIEARIAKDMEDFLRDGRTALLRCESSEDLSWIPERSVDAVVTDPPYFDNVMYSELADFFYVWLRLALANTYPWFIPLYSNRAREIVKNDKLGKTTEFFNEGLTTILRECHRVLKKEGLLIFTFHHNKPWAWEGVANILMQSGFYISASPIVRSEGKSGFHSSKGNIRYDACLVCRKQPAPQVDTAWSSLEEQILEDAAYWAKRTIESGMWVNEVDIFAIVMAKTIEHYTKAWPAVESSSHGTSIAAAIDRMQTLVKLVKDLAHQELPEDRTQSNGLVQLAFVLAESRAHFESGAGNRQQ